MTRLLTACAVLSLAACAPMTDENGDGIADGVQSPNSVSSIAPATPIGTVSGVVVNALNQGIDGVQVTLVLGEGADATKTYKTTTTTDGAWVIKGVPAGGQGQVLLSKGGFSSAKLNFNVPASTGNIPLNDGNANTGVVTLTQFNSTLRFRVYTTTGRPAQGAKAFLEVQQTAFSTFSGVYGNAVGNYTGTADVDENGLLTFTGAPDPSELSRINANINYQLTIGAIDSDMDGRSDVLGTLQTFSASQLFIQPDRQIFLSDVRTQTGAGLRILATNLDSFDTANSPPYKNALKATDPITIVFNQPITQVDTTRLVKVVQEDCQTMVPVSITQRTPNTLSIAPTAPWNLGNRYNIIVRATGLDNGVTQDFIGYFFAIDPTAPRPLSSTATFQVRKFTGNMMNNALQPGDRLFVLFDTPIINQGATPARTIINFDLNGDGNVGGMTGTGEFNGPANSGVPIVIAEQNNANDPALGTFSCKSSGYSSRWEITIPNFPAAGSIPFNPGAAPTQLRVLFPREQSSSDTYQTSWGAPVTNDVTGTMTLIP